jgi:mRNA interferase RelE/StbE
VTRSRCARGITNVGNECHILVYQAHEHGDLATEGPEAAEETGRQGRILAATATLSAFPNVANVKALIGHEYGYRLRVGNYRVFFNALAAISIVRIEEVKKRDERTY